MHSADEPNEIKIYENIEQKCRRFVPLLMKFGFGSSVMGVSSPIFILTFIAMLMGNFDTSKWYFPIAYVVPFDDTTILGFYGKTVLYSVYGLNSYFLVIVTAIGYFSSCCFYLNGFVENFQLMFDEMDQIVSQNKRDTAKETTEIHNRLKRAVDFHAKMFE